ncbi:hypothetical protein D1007_54105 [Hordeum vulgare]|nr:hypothetical protein D1007_54105 [Hordeum vulgare]
MAVEKLLEVNPPSRRVLGRGLLMLPISKALRLWNDREIRDSGYSGRVSDRRGKYKPKEGVRGEHQNKVWQNDEDLQKKEMDVDKKIQKLAINKEKEKLENDKMKEEFEKLVIEHKELKCIAIS